MKAEETKTVKQLDKRLRILDENDMNLEDSYFCRALDRTVYINQDTFDWCFAEDNKVYVEYEVEDGRFVKEKVDFYDYEKGIYNFYKTEDDTVCIHEYSSCHYEPTKSIDGTRFSIQEAKKEFFRCKCGSTYVVDYKNNKKEYL